MTTENKLPEPQDTETAGNPVTILTDEECWALAEKTEFARLGTMMDGEIFITLVNITVSAGKIYFRTAAGSKLTNLLLDEKVTIQFDQIEGKNAYSVNVHGTARLLTDSKEIEEATSLGLNPWLETEKIEFVEITPTSSTGRRFLLNR